MRNSKTYEERIRDGIINQFDGLETREEAVRFAHYTITAFELNPKYQRAHILGSSFLSRMMRGLQAYDFAVSNQGTDIFRRYI